MEVSPFSFKGEYRSEDLSVIQEMDISIMGISGMRLTGNGYCSVQDCEVYFSG